MVSTLEVLDAPCSDKTCARSSNKIQGFECDVNLSEEEGRTRRDNDQFKLTVKQTGKIRVEALQAYLKKEMAWDNSVLECISE